MKKVVLILLFLFFIGSVFAANPLSNFSGNFTEGFESGTFATNSWLASGGTTSNWTVATTNPYSGTYHAQASNVDAEASLTLNISTENYGSINFSFFYRTVGLDAGEYFRAEWYNGTTWINVLNVTTNVGYLFANYSLPSSANNKNSFAVRFKCLNDGGPEFCRVDNINILGKKILQINLTDIYLIDQNGNRLLEANNTAVETVDLMKINFSVDSIEEISSWYLNFSANGTNGCSLGNKQSIICYSYPNWIQFINGTETDTFDARLISQSDYITSTIDSGNLTNFSFSIDEHYNPNVFKWYSARFNYSDLKWQNETNVRITGNNSIKIKINSSLVPIDMDLARLDLRVNYVGQPERLKSYACNSTYNNSDFRSYPGCALIVERTYSELEEDGTKYKGFFSKNLIDTIGDLGYIILHTEETNTSEYYYIRTYKATAENYSTNWNYSNNLGNTWNNSEDGYETQMNINWYYSGAQPTAFVYRLWINTTSGYENYTEGNFTWEIDPSQNYEPILTLYSPTTSQYLSLPTNISFVARDLNDDSLNVSFYLYKNNSLNYTIINGLNENDTSYLWNTSIDGNYDFVMKVCELNTPDLYCRNITREVTVDNVFPLVYSPYPENDSEFYNEVVTEISVNVTEENLNFIYVNVTFPNSTLVTYYLNNSVGEKYNASVNLNLAGNYNLTFYAKDLAENVNESITSYFNIYDNSTPLLEVLHPLGENFTTIDDIALVLNFSDFSSYDKIYSNVTMPNGTILYFNTFHYSLESDNFETNSVGTNWDNVSEDVSMGQTCYMDIDSTYESKMFFSILGEGSTDTTYCGFNSLHKLEGNFDVEIEFNASLLEDDSIFVFRSSNLETFHPEGIRVYLLLTKSGENLIYEIGYGNPEVNSTSVIVNNTSGKFRIKRFNVTEGTPVFSLFYWNETSLEWVNPLGNISLNTSSITQFLQIYAVSSPTNYGNINVTLEGVDIISEDNIYTHIGNFDVEGRYNVTFFINDSSGNSNTNETHFFIYATNHAPSRPLILNPDIGDFVSGISSINWIEVTDTENDELQYNITLLNSDNSINSTIVTNYGNINISNYSCNTATFTDGDYKIKITVFENNTENNYSTSDTMSGIFTIDNTNPNITINYSTSSTNEIDFDVSSYDENFANLTVFLYSSSGLIDSLFSEVENVSSSFSRLSSGTYYLNATAYDLSGNSIDTTTGTIIFSSNGETSSSGSVGTYTIKLESETEKNLILYKNKIVKFNIKNESHSIQLLNLNNSSLQILIYSDLFEKILNVGDIWKIDFDSDSIYDLKVQLNSVHNGQYANLTLEEIYEYYEPKIPEKLFDIKLSLEENKIKSLGELKAIVTYENFGTIPTEINLTFQIIDSKGIIVYEEFGKINVSVEETKGYTFPELNLTKGDYELVFTTKYGNNIEDKFTQKFEIKKNNLNSIIIGIFSLFVIWFIVIIIIKFKKEKNINFF